ncbi:MAG: MarR family transcriptional regulator [Clostridia bacterium]|nr:MarR family transcriptional regulator [Clostridia bacterium]
MAEQKYEVLKLENQLCFPLYALAKETIKLYRPLLDEINLTYTQYIAMMVIWEKEKINVKELGKRLYLDSGTLTPVLKSLEAKGFITRHRSAEDERILMVEITDKGTALKDEAVKIPGQIVSNIEISLDDAIVMHRQLYNLLEQLTEKKQD